MMTRSSRAILLLVSVMLTSAKALRAALKPEGVPSTTPLGGANQSYWGCRIKYENLIVFVDKLANPNNDTISNFVSMALQSEMGPGEDSVEIEYYSYDNGMWRFRLVSRKDSEIFDHFDITDEGDKVHSLSDRVNPFKDLLIPVTTEFDMTKFPCDEIAEYIGRYPKKGYEQRIDWLPMFVTDFARKVETEIGRLKRLRTHV
ncbi:hypothetical protein FOZ62_011802 [Perkinsus olseni]|uniref:Uncharacterized protein n=1 Tax=Perkinsus olseni TaxID=32597 RepID=A0A7J6Q5A3_PEROL|nr:hypothetical protein FOZ62_011802 [Perkinsus olseni]